MARLVLHQNEIDNLSLSSGPVGAFVAGFADEVARVAQATAPIDSGRLKANVAVSGPVIGAHGILARRVFTDPQSPGRGYRYALTVHQGRRAIRGKTSPLMKFTGRPKAGRFAGVTTETSAVSGVAGRPFLTDALRDVGLALPDVVWRDTTFNEITGDDVRFPFLPDAEPR